jgi:molybdate transport system substrate-binding protein
LKRLVAALSLALLLSAASFSEGELLVSAAASLTDVLSGFRADAEEAVGTGILLNFGGSGTLRKQIEEGAPVDVFFSASSEDMDRLAKAGLLEPGSRVDLLSNSIVLVGDAALPKPSGAEELRALLSRASLVAIGNPATVPAGRYATQAFASLGLDRILAGKLALGGSVREVLQFLSSGSAPLGVVFLTDAMTLAPADRTAILYRFPESALASPVLYPVAVVAASRSRDKAARYVGFLRGEVARGAFARAGFAVK